MRFRYYKKLDDPKLLEGIRELLVLCDKEFVPPLSARKSPTQTDLSAQAEDSSDVSAYFDEVCSQSAVVVTDKDKVTAFMSFRSDYVCEYVSPAHMPNLYVTTVIVSPEFRHEGIAGKMYDFLIKKFPSRYLLTRTWSTNISHIRILLSRNFHEHCVLSNDRGENIDTVYFRKDPDKTGFLRYISQYRLGGNIFFGVLLMAITLIFICVWLLSGEGIVHELSLAIATSLMASFLCLFSDVFLKIRESRNDKFITTLKNYGIENFQFNKNELLEKIIPDCRKEIWISGYRLVMTGKQSFRNALETACKRSRHLKVRLLAVPPWSQTYSLVYGDEDTTLNYIKVLGVLAECHRKYNTVLEVRFSEKPIFSDTYKVDDRFVTGPYLHCSDTYNNRITAKDFFSLDITSPESELYQLMDNDYMTVWNEATCELDVEKFIQKFDLLPDAPSMTRCERTELIKDCIISLKNKKTGAVR